LNYIRLVREESGLFVVNPLEAPKLSIEQLAILTEANKRIAEYGARDLSVVDDEPSNLWPEVGIPRAALLAFARVDATTARTRNDDGTGMTPTSPDARWAPEFRAPLSAAILVWEAGAFEANPQRPSISWSGSLGVPDASGASRVEINGTAMEVGFAQAGEPHDLVFLVSVWNTCASQPAYSGWTSWQQHLAQTRVSYAWSCVFRATVSGERVVNAPPRVRVYISESPNKRLTLSRLVYSPSGIISRKTALLSRALEDVAAGLVPDANPAQRVAAHVLLRQNT
jgi:hypothetical protein